MRDWNEHPAARAEFLDAVGYYVTINHGQLASEFVQASKAAANVILLWPDAGPPYLSLKREPPIRAWHLGNFPYSLVYMAMQDEVHVLANAHESRKPGYWLPRLEEF